MNKIKIKIINSSIHINLNMKNENKWHDILDLKGKLTSKQQNQVCLTIASLFHFMPKSDQQVQLKNTLNIFRKTDFKDKIIFYPGSFNPFHHGHLECLKQLNGAPILVVPDNNPWKDQYSTGSLNDFLSIYQQIKELNVSIFSGFIGMSIPNPTIDWIEQVKIKQIFLLMGDDSFLSLHNWKRSDDLIKLLKGIYVIPRNESSQQLKNQERKLKNINKKLQITFMNSHIFEDMTSSEIRKNNSDLYKRLENISMTKDIEIKQAFLDELETTHSIDHWKNKSKPIFSNLDAYYKLSDNFKYNSNFFNRIFDVVFGLNHLCPNIYQKLSKRLDSLYFKKESSYYHFCLSYRRIIDILYYLKPNKGETLIDLGSGFGRIGQFVGHVLPNIRFVGLEINTDLLEVSKKLAGIYNFNNVNYNHFDLLDSDQRLPRGKYYISYDPFPNHLGEELYDKFEKIFRESKIEIFLVIICGWTNNGIEIMDKKKWANCVHSFLEYESDGPIKIYSNLSFK